MRQALEQIADVCTLRAVSNLYETKAIGPPQPDYLNAALLVGSSLAPLELLAALMAVEEQFDRIRTQRWGARTLDLDLLWSEGVTVSLPQLSVPHPRLKERAFAILPLLDVAPTAADPLTGVPYASLVCSQGDAGVRQIDDWGWAGQWVLAP
jgi:2-amino-4-hydroxy-6-hydroxymethyldihydropteridine diphosphokinase